MVRRSLARGVLRHVGLLLCLLVSPSASERHYGDPHKNCRVDVQVSLPRARRAAVKGRPSWGGWQLAEGGKLLAVRGNALTRLDPATGSEAELQGGLSVEAQIQAGAGAGGIYLLTAASGADSQAGKVELTAYATGTWAKRWGVEPFPGVPLPLLAAPVATADRVFVGAANRIGGLDPANGRAVWSRTLQALVGCCPALAGDAVVLPTTHGLEALSLSDGRTLWKSSADPNAFDPSRGPAVEDGKVYFTFDERTVTALDLRTGAVLWRSQGLASPIDTRHPPVADGTGLLVPLHGGLARLSGTGDLLWEKTYPFIRRGAAKPAVLATTGAAFLGGADGLYAVSPETGEVTWRETGLGQVIEVEYIGSELVVVNSNGGVFSFPP